MKNKKAPAPTMEALPWWKFFQFNKISEGTGINRFKLYNNIKGTYSSLTPDDKKAIADLMAPHVISFFERLGYIVRINK